ncbi:hypothetical protein A3755_09390 [Oleiphilus sp. HI0085]|uniref:PPC domain-containing protein n=1 Tax=Oleiphilus sp. HI0132 TaxID=1822270 RepID=UPI0007C334EE|nr:PPC domain-containing protein [Oleiphilus sp. HI0132]KZZ32642.1 hypothetical protein A3755_09390 [Oleiphilus sp. HI0085]
MKLKHLSIILLPVLLAACGTDSKIPGSEDPSPEDPNTGSTAEVLSLQMPLLRELTTDLEDNTKEFRYTSPKEQTVTLRVSNVEGPNSGINSFLFIDAKSPTGSVFVEESVSATNTFNTDIELDKNEVLDIELSCFGTFCDDYFEFEVEVLPSSLDGELDQNTETFEPNETNNTAKLAELNKTYLSELLIGGEDKADVYQYSLTKGIIYSIKSVNLQGSGSTTAGGLQFEVTDEDGSPVVSNYDLHQDIASSSEFSVTETGTYYLRVLSQHGTIYQNDYFKYEVAIWEPRETWDNPHSTGNNMEPNETPRLAYAVDVSQPIVSQLEMGSRDNVDSYAVALYPGNQYLLTVTATDGPNRSSASRLQIKVTDEDGTVSFVPESPLSVGVEQQFIIESLTQTNAVIELFYNYTNGHLEDYHAFEFEVTLQ